MEKDIKQLSDDELRIEEYEESCRDDGFGPRLRALREEMKRRKLGPLAHAI